MNTNKHDRNNTNVNQMTPWSSWLGCLNSIGLSHWFLVTTPKSDPNWVLGKIGRIPLTLYSTIYHHLGQKPESSCLVDTKSYIISALMDLPSLPQPQRVVLSQLPTILAFLLVFYSSLRYQYSFQSSFSPMHIKTYKLTGMGFGPYHFLGHTKTRYLLLQGQSMVLFPDIADKVILGFFSPSLVNEMEIPAPVPR